MGRRNPEAPTFEQRREVYTRMYADAKVLPRWVSYANRAAQCIIDARPALEEVSALTGVPWQIIGMLQLREAGLYQDKSGVWHLNFNGHLHNGDPLTARTKQIPAGRPRNGQPPFTWKESALDAIKLAGLDKVEVWSTELFLYDGEAYNGWGYVWYHPWCNSPYLWAGTDQYKKGKYTSDGNFDPEHVDQQLGIVAVVKTLDARGMWLPPVEHKDTRDIMTWTTDVYPKADAFRDDSVKSADLVAEGSRSMTVLQFLKWKLGIGTGGVGVYEAMKFFTDGKDTIADVLEIVDRHLVTILKLAGVSTLVMVGFAIYFFAEAARDGRYDPRKAQVDADPHVA